MKKSLEREALLSTFQDRIGYKFKNMALLEEALTHSSYANESGLSRFLTLGYILNISRVCLSAAEAPQRSAAGPHSSSATGASR